MSAAFNVRILGNQYISDLTASIREVLGIAATENLSLYNVAIPIEVDSALDEAYRQIQQRTVKALKPWDVVGDVVHSPANSGIQIVAIVASKLSLGALNSSSLTIW